MMLKNKFIVTFSPSFGPLLLVNFLLLSSRTLAGANPQNPTNSNLQQPSPPQGRPPQSMVMVTPPSTLNLTSLNPTSTPTPIPSPSPSSSSSTPSVPSPKHHILNKTTSSEGDSHHHQEEHGYQSDQGGGGGHHYSHLYQQDGHHYYSSGGVSASSLISRDNCKLPDNWKGEWFQSGAVSSILIDQKSIGDKGNCMERSGDKYLFYEKASNCYKCIVINERHPNVLQYKESPFCEEGRESLEHLCSQIPGDATLFSLFRIDAQPEDCPFKGPFTFTYNRGHGECKNPVSFIDTCTEPNRLRLRYQACPDIVKTESAAEELQCLAQWKEGSHHYLLGKIRLDHRSITTNEEAYRCFIYEKTKSGHVGFNVAMSGDATCTGVFSPTEGARALVLSKVEKEQIKCKFPPWFVSHHWSTLDGKMSTKIHHKNSTIHISEEGTGSGGNFGRNLRNFSTPGGTNLGGNWNSYSGFATNILSPPPGPPPLFTVGTRVVCQSRRDINERQVAIVAHHTQGCKSESICMHIYKRDNHVVEVQMLRKSEHGMEDSDCFKQDALGPRVPYVTLLNQDAKAHRCPNLGKFAASGVSQDGRVVRDSCNGGGGGVGGFHSVVVGCGQRATMEFHSKCATQDPITAYECHGAWEENGTGYLIASPLTRTSISSTLSRRYCFIYSEADEGLRVSSSSESCKRNVSPGVEGVLAFNLTVSGQCAEAVTGGGYPSVSRKSCDLLLFSTVPFLLVLLVSHFNINYYFNNNVGVVISR